MHKLKTYTLKEIERLCGIPYHQLLNNKEEMGLIAVERADGKSRRERFIFPSVAELLLPALSSVKKGLDPLQPPVVNENDGRGKSEQSAKRQFKKNESETQAETSD